MLKNSLPGWYLQRRMRKRSIREAEFSQYGQDLWVWDLLGRPDEGFYLDIGANDGVSLSNTLFFERLGWRGVCIEPNPHVFSKLEENRSANCVNACLSSEVGEVNFLAIEGDSNMLSGIYEFMDAKDLERIKRETGQTSFEDKLIKVESLRPIDLLQAHSIPTIDFMSLDIEGAELSVLNCFDFDQVNIRAISVENGTGRPDIFRLLRDRGFALQRVVGCDEIYLYDA